MPKNLFFRNDDVRHKLDQSLIDITKLFIDKKIPIIHAVEPANITEEVAGWLLETKKAYPEYVDIMQHGFEHKIKNKFLKGEFGGQRNYEEQYNDIRQGKDLMNNWFGDLWFPAFNFPYAPYNPPAIKAVNDLNYKVINSHYNDGLTRKIFYFVGHLLNKGYLFDHHVSWNLDFYPGTNLFEIDMNISFIEKYLNEEEDAEFFTLQEMISKTIQYSKYETTGVLLHHRYHNTESKIKLVEDYLNWCLGNEFSFTSIPEIYNRYK